MSVSLNDTALYLASFQNIASLTDTNMPTGLLAAIRQSINAAVSKMKLEAPDVFRKPLQQQLSATTSGTVSVTANSATLVADGTLTLDTTYHNGCTIKIEGDSSYKRVYLIDGAWKLVGAYKGTTGSHTAQVWMDCINLGSEQLLADVYADGRLLTGITDKSELQETSRGRMSYGEWVPANQIPPTPESGTVEAYYGQQVFLTGMTAPQNHLIFYPLPSSATFIDSATSLSQKFSVSDLSDAALYVHMPADLEELVFIPFVLDFFAGTTFGKDKAALASAREEARAAMEYLRNYRPAPNVSPLAYPG